MKHWFQKVQNVIWIILHDVFWVVAYLNFIINIKDKNWGFKGERQSVKNALVLGGELIFWQQYFWPFFASLLH